MINWPINKENILTFFAFELFQEKHPFHFAAKKSLSNAFVAHMENSLQKLKIFFSEGKASPNDINSDGKTILHVSGFYINEISANSHSLP